MSGSSSRFLTLLICLNQTLVAVLPATAPVGSVEQRSVKNPFRKESWNLTEQMKLQKTDPQLAARLKAAA